MEIWVKNIFAENISKKNNYTYLCTRKENTYILQHVYSNVQVLDSLRFLKVVNVNGCTSVYSYFHKGWLAKSALPVTRIAKHGGALIWPFVLKLNYDNEIFYWLLNDNSNNDWHFLTICYCMFLYGWFKVWVSYIVVLSNGIFRYMSRGWLGFVCLVYKSADATQRKYRAPTIPVVLGSAFADVHFLWNSCMDL